MNANELKCLNLLVVEDEPLLRRQLAAHLEQFGADVTAADTVAATRQWLRNEPFDFVLLDVNLPDGLGTDLLREKAFPSATTVIVMTANGGVASAVEAMRLGAADYLVKPFDPSELPLVIARAQRARNSARLDEQRRDDTAQAASLFFFGRALANVEVQLGKILQADTRMQTCLPPALIEGETGTGKTTIARWLHERGPRAARPFVEINCSALPETLAESELFGHERGAFTGAMNAKLGLMEMAEKGTLFLDEIGELPAGLQSKLLRALQEREIRRVGGTRQIPVDIRVVSATNRDLKAHLPEGRFREDLYYRINVVDIPLPPLRERKGDITLLAHFALKKFTEKSSNRIVGFEPEVLTALEAYGWPGNVRELQNVIERACALADGERVTLADIPEHLRAPMPVSEIAVPSDLGARLTLKEAKERWVNQLESAYVAEVLKREGGNVSQAARKAGIDRKTLHRLLHKYSLR